MTKAAIRKLYKEKRASISNSEFEKLTDLLLIQFQELGLYLPNLILSYLAYTRFNEIDLSLIEQFCSWKNPECSFCYPIINDVSNTMVAAATTDDRKFSANKYGILEPPGDIAILPKDIDMVFVPLLSFDKNGYRVGYGKGYYDKFLANCREDLVKVGFSFFDAQEELIEKNAFDIPLDYCITPHRNYQF